MDIMHSGDERDNVFKEDPTPRRVLRSQKVLESQSHRPTTYGKKTRVPTTQEDTKRN